MEGSMPHAVARIGDTVIADSDETMFVEGNHYFPASDVNFDMLSKTDHHTVCHWKGDASYYTVKINGQEYENAAWTYHEPKTKQAEPLKDMIAFYSNIVTVEEK